MKKIINWVKMQWEIFAYVDSTDGVVDADVYGDDYVNRKIQTIRNKYKTR